MTRHPGGLDTGRFERGDGLAGGGLRCVHSKDVCGGAISRRWRPGGPDGTDRVAASSFNQMTHADSRLCGLFRDYRPLRTVSV